MTKVKDPVDFGLTKEDFFTRLSFDQETGVFTWIKNGKAAGSLDHQGYIRIWIFGRLWMAHRLAWLFITGDFVGRDEQIDHIDGNRSSNKKENLRKASQTQNTRNSGLRRNNTSGIKGVYFDKSRGKWQATCRAGGQKGGNIGRFDRIEDAEAAVIKAREEKHGEFCNHG